MLELVPGLAGRAHAGSLRRFMHMLVIAPWTQIEAGGGSGGDSKSREKCTWDDHTSLKTFSTLRIKCSFLNWGPWGFYFSGHSSLLSVHYDLTNIAFLQCIRFSLPGQRLKKNQILRHLISTCCSLNLSVWLRPLHFQDSGYFLQEIPCPHPPALGCVSFEVSPSTRPHCIVTI